MTASWVVVSKDTGKAVLETYSPAVVNVVNTEKYKIIPILEYLVSINGKEVVT